MSDTFRDIEKLEADLWAAADNLRANSKLTSSDYFMPVLGIIFLRHAANRYAAANWQIAEDKAAGRMPKRAAIDADFIRRRALPLPETAKYEWIMAKASSGEVPLPTLVTDAMRAIEEKFDPLRGVLPKDYGIFEPKVLEDLLRLFNSEQIQQATGDVFGRIYEYFLAKFSIQKAHDNGEFFTPASLVQMIVNVIEPDHGRVFDPACGSGGMFVQTSYFIEQKGGDTAHKVVFYGQEKNPDTIRIAQMNLAVHGLTGEIADAITYYEDNHNLVGGCDFVMANPPFNVDLVDAERIKTDTQRLPFGLPSVNKQKKVSNGNYLWISYFWSYLNATGRAGFVMSSQASSAGHGERDVREKIVKTGDVDLMMSVRSNFFYTRAVPCELWFFDRGKPAVRRDQVLMIDARNVFRKVNRTINDFSPEQMANLSAIVWLYRGQRNRFLALVQRYLAAIGDQCAAIPDKIVALETTLTAVREKLDAFAAALATRNGESDDRTRTTADALKELRDALPPYEQDQKALLADLAKFAGRFEAKPPATTKPQHTTHKAFDPLAERIKGLIKQIDLLYKLTDRTHDQIGKLLSDMPEDGMEGLDYDRRSVGRLLKQLDDGRKAAVEQLRQPVYFHRQAAWLLDRFPDGMLVDVPGLVKLVNRAEIEAADWSLTPGRYVGVAPSETDQNFDFEEAIHDIHVELAGLNEEAAMLAKAIQTNFEELRHMKLNEVRLDELGTVSRGRSRHRPRDAEHLYGGPYPFFQTGDIKHASLYLNDYTQTYSEAGLAQSKLWPAGTMCITIAAYIAETAILGIDACFPDSVIGFIAYESKADNRYIKYLFDTIKQKYRQVSKGATQDNLSLEKLLSFPLRVPDVVAQRRIGDVLSAYDQVVENNRRRMTLLEESARHLYQEWFVRLRFPGHEHTRVIDGVPEGWQRRTVGDCAVFQSGGTPSKSKSGYWDGDIPWISSGEMTTLRLLDSSLHLTQEGLEQGSRLVPPNTILAVVRGMSLAKEFRIAMTGRAVAFNQDLKALTCTADISPEFFFNALVARRDEVRDRATEASHGTKKLDTAVLAAVAILLPSCRLQKLYSDVVRPANSLWDNLWQQNRALKRVRDLLLPRLLSGEVAV